MRNTLTQSSVINNNTINRNYTVFIIDDRFQPKPVVNIIIKYLK